MPLEMLPPSTQIKVLRRGFHALALLQNDEEKWNVATLTKCIENDPAEKIDPEVTLADNNIKDAIESVIKEALELDIDRRRGVRKISLAEDIPQDDIVGILSIYAYFVVHDSSRIAVFDALYRKNAHQCMWLLAKLYFASKSGAIISFQYETNHGEKKFIEMKPYHIVYRNNNLYLTGKSVHDNHLRLFIVNRITELQETGKSFNVKEIPDAESLFKHSLGSFVSDKVYHMTITYAPDVKNMLMEVFSSLDPEFSKEGDAHRMTVDVCDLQTVCKQLLLFGDKVEIVEPAEVRNYMIDMLKKSLSVYK